MEEAEKMAALKKVYADIILNTAKEAAVRIMVSERKALRFQKELSAGKEEALNMLLRLKQIVDSKIAESEIASFNQQRRIEELETQLHEAQEIVRDLRSELQGVQDELERLKSNPENLLDGQIVMGITTHEEEAQEDKLNTFDGASCHPPFLECRPMQTCIMKNAHLNQSDDKCCSLSENRTAQIETTNNSPMENYCAGNPDLACIIMRSKEPELYRNGCTQRIRAFEGNLLDGEKLPLPSNDDDQCLHIKSGEKVEGNGTVASPKTDNMTVAVKNMSESEEVMQPDSSCDKGQAGSFVRRFSNRRRRTRYRNSKATLCRSLLDPCEPSVHSHSKTYPYPVNGNGESGEDPSKVFEDKAQRNLESHVDSVAMDTEGGSPHNVTSKDPAFIHESLLTIQEYKDVENSEVPGSKLNLDPVDLQSVNSDAKDTKTCEMTTAPPAEAATDRLLKYTFQRKRKKETMSNLIDNAPLEKINPTKRRAVETQNSTLEPQKSSLIIESSRGSRRLAQVARQLISLSEKKWL